MKRAGTIEICPSTDPHVSMRYVPGAKNWDECTGEYRYAVDQSAGQVDATLSNPYRSRIGRLVGNESTRR
jgi:hypothetical protein